jgi:transcriptional regulator with XRE-family HTH domain
MEFGGRVKELRTGLNYSQKELSEKTGLTLRTIQRIEKNEVKPSLYSLKVLGETLGKDLANVELKSAAKPYEFNFSIKITDMNQLISDLKTGIKNNWKIILLVVLVIYLISNYTDFKAGIVDGWKAN